MGLLSISLLLERGFLGRTENYELAPMAVFNFQENQQKVHVLVASVPGAYVCTI